MEVHGVCSEPVSVSISLFNRVNTGKFDVLGVVNGDVLVI